MATRVSVFDLMVGHVVIQSRWYRDRAHRVPWSRLVAIAIHTRRPKYGEAWPYLDLAERLRKAAQARIRTDRQRPQPATAAQLAAIDAAILRATLRTEPGLIRAAAVPPPAWQATARRAILESDAPTSVRTRVLGLRKPAPPPVPIAARILPRPAPTWNGVLLTPGQHQAIGASLERMAHAGASRARAIPASLDRLALAVNARRQ